VLDSFYCWRISFSHKRKTIVLRDWDTHFSRCYWRTHSIIWTRMKNFTQFNQFFDISNLSLYAISCHLHHSEKMITVKRQIIRTQALFFFQERVCVLYATQHNATQHNTTQHNNVWLIYEKHFKQCYSLCI
jgi:hypothetical protein